MHGPQARGDVQGLGAGREGAGRRHIREGGSTQTRCRSDTSHTGHGIIHTHRSASAHGLGHTREGGEVISLYPPPLQLEWVLVRAWPTCSHFFVCGLMDGYCVECMRTLSLHSLAARVLGQVPGEHSRHGGHLTPVPHSGQLIIS